MDAVDDLHVSPRFASHPLGRMPYMGTNVLVAVDPRAHAEALSDIAAMLAGQIAHRESLDHVLPSELARLHKRLDAATAAAQAAWAQVEGLGEQLRLC